MKLLFAYIDMVTAATTFDEVLVFPKTSAPSSMRWCKGLAPCRSMVRAR